VKVVGLAELASSSFSRELVGEEHDAGICIIFVEAPPGRGPALHRHPYEEIFIVQEGEALFVAGGEERTVRAGEVVVAPANTPHRFVNTGPGVLRQIDIHVSPRFVTEWLDDS
jgi:mannose-6-phosphate isomerase-like protein (cupin superfamily)